MPESVAFDRVAASYDDTRGGMERGRQVAAALAELLPTGGPLLEVGVGTGLIAAGMAELGRPPLGVDLSVPMLARARDRIPGRLAVGDALRLPVRAGSVAGAYLVHVLHLVADVPATLAELRRVLRPGGVLVATAFAGGPVPGDVHAEMERIRRDLGGRPPVVDAPLVARLAAEAGFEPVGERSLGAVGLSPRAAGDLVEARSLSWMWAVDDASWAAGAPPVLQRLRGLPDQDVERPAPGPTVLAFRRP